MATRSRVVGRGGAAAPRASLTTRIAASKTMEEKPRCRMGRPLSLHRPSARQREEQADGREERLRCGRNIECHARPAHLYVVERSGQRRAFSRKTVAPILAYFSRVSGVTPRTQVRTVVPSS